MGKKFGANGDESLKPDFGQLLNYSEEKDNQMYSREGAPGSVAIDRTNLRETNISEDHVGDITRRNTALIKAVADL